MSALVNMKTFVQAVCKPFIKALKCFYERQTKVVLERGVKNDESVAKVQTQLAKLMTEMEDLSAKMIRQESDLATLRANLYTSAEFKRMLVRERQLEHICYQLYSIVYELLLNGTSSRSHDDLLDYDNPKTDDPEAQY